MEWIKASEKSPEHSGYYLAKAKSGMKRVICYSTKYAAWNCHDEMPKDMTLAYLLTVTDWLPLPYAFGEKSSDDPVLAYKINNAIDALDELGELK